MHRSSDTTLDILGLIPARAGSKGIPGKNLSLLAGQPLLVHTLQAAKSSQLLTRVILSTDSAEMAELGRKHGVEVPFLRPSGLAQDDTPTFPVIEHALEWLRTEESYQPDVIVLLQPTAPLRTSKHIDEAIELLLQSDADTVISVTAVPKHFHPAWQLVNGAEGGLRLYDGEPLPKIVARRQELSTTYTRNGALYVVWLETIRRFGGLYGDKCLPYVMPSEDSVNADSWLDLCLAELLIKERAGK